MIEYYPSGWEVDWTRRSRNKNGQTLVWGRNPGSDDPASTDWHWIIAGNVYRLGIDPPPASGLSRTKGARGEDRLYSSGYVLLHRRAMDTAQIAVADSFGLWRGQRVREHCLVAAIRYGRDYDPSEMVVRHWNGWKDDNRPTNILIGTHAENMMDHATARKWAMRWHQENRELVRENAELTSGYAELERENAALDAEVSALRARLAARSRPVIAMAAD